MDPIEKKLQELGLTLPGPPAPGAASAATPSCLASPSEVRFRGSLSGSRGDTAGQ